MIEDNELNYTKMKMDHGAAAAEDPIDRRLI